ncbi:hypothetical protein BDM02DRAFT_325326 [Thelephora ganbajun]|uniref:Uncharacterized protein n=1 Tax=Thelephora ganbajun TaxID=370292 RepID=A0ACB6ZQF1_THEGA|nr:hypothetical protein BDM02DRAFT_325326 [Thelephora ganbajun]
MKFLALAAVAATVIVEVSAHTRVWSIWLSGSDQGAGAGRYILQPPTNNPVKNLTSSDIRCNVNGYSPVATYVSTPAGGIVTTEWYHDYRGDDIIATSHKGPIRSNGGGDIWVKIFHEGSTGHWAVEKLLSNRGKYDIPVPSNLAPGQYILRVEIIALHEADSLYSQDPARGAQFYPSCIQIQVTGSGSRTLPSGVSFPGAYSDSTPGIKWNIYDNNIDQRTYPIPGPAAVNL